VRAGGPGVGFVCRATHLSRRETGGAFEFRIALTFDSLPEKMDRPAFENGGRPGGSQECYNAAMRSESVLAAKDISKLLLGIPRGAWVALSADEGRLIAYAADATEVVKRAKELGESNPVIVRVREDPSSLLVECALGCVSSPCRGS
jgi:hypothetical protein